LPGFVIVRERLRFQVSASRLEPSSGFSMNPLDFKEAFLPKHAQHVVLVHFPIALFVVGVAFDVVAQWRKRVSLTAAAYYNFAMAAFSTVPTIATGLLAWRFQLESQKLEGLLLLHLILGGVSSALIWLVWCVHLRTRRSPERTFPAYRFPVEFLTVAVVTITGYLGGFLSGVNSSC
jgi:uncharacterized membrane protein